MVLSSLYGCACFSTARPRMAGPRVLGVYAACRHAHHQISTPPRCCSIMLFMAVTSTGSAELIAVSSLFSYDLYR